jgi:chemotaxis protein CheC
MIKQVNVEVSSEFAVAESLEVLGDKQKENLGVFLELGSIGAGHAATALSEVLQQPVSIEVPKLLTVPAHMIQKYYRRYDAPTEAVHLQLLDDCGCDILLLIELSEAKKIAAVMTMAASIDECDGEIQSSAIKELANILIGSFLTAISDFSGVKLLPTTPHSIIDGFDSIIDNFLVKQSMTSEEALVFETRLKRSGQDSDSLLMIFPSLELKEKLLKYSKRLIEV